MKIQITHVGGWNNGGFQYNGQYYNDFIKAHGRSPTPVMGTLLMITLDGVEDTAVVTGERTIHGSDSDHGHEYSWTFTDYEFFLDGDRLKRKEKIQRLLDLGAKITYVVRG